MEFVDFSPNHYVFLQWFAHLNVVMCFTNQVNLREIHLLAGLTPKYTLVKFHVCWWKPREHIQGFRHVRYIKGSPPFKMYNILKEHVPK